MKFTIDRRKLGAALVIFSGFLLLSACTGIPSQVKPVQNFDLVRYLGVWYEIARLDHRFETGLDDICATYSVRKDGGIDVLNQGLDRVSGEWQQAQGKAYFIGEQDVARLKVSFFWPFYSSYNVIALDEADYRYAMVTGPDRSYLWILARSPDLLETTVQKLVEQAKQLNYDTAQLIYVKHDNVFDGKPFCGPKP